MIAVPFVCGVAAASAATYNYMVQSEFSLALVLLCLSLMMIKKSTDLGLGIMAFFSLGWFCYANHALMPDFPLKASIPTIALEALKRRIHAVPFSNPETPALAEALLTGSKSALQQSTIEAFRNSGASHVLALSGLHLGLIASLVSRLLSVFGKRRYLQIGRSLIVITLSALYTLMCGASASLVRAFIFICIRELRYNRRDLGASSVDALCAAAFIQLCMEPEAVQSIAFQLSYLAMGGIFLLHPLINGFYPKGKGPFNRIWESMSLSLSCQIFTAPLVWKAFGSLPMHFLLTNLIALPLVEAFIVLSLICISAPEAIPGPIVSFCELCGDLLMRSMQIISTM